MERKRYGIQIDDTGDIVVRNGSLALGDTLVQNECLLIVSHPGEIKEHPSMGAGIADMVGDNGCTEAKRKIRESFKADGLNIVSIEMTDKGEVRRLEASYQ